MTQAGLGSPGSIQPGLEIAVQSSADTGIYPKIRNTTQNVRVTFSRPKIPECRHPALAPYTKRYSEIFLPRRSNIPLSSSTIRLPNSRPDNSSPMFRFQEAIIQTPKASMDCYAYGSMIASWPLVAAIFMFNIWREQFETTLGEVLVEDIEYSIRQVFNPRTRDDVEAFMNSKPGWHAFNCVCDTVYGRWHMPSEV